LDASSASRGLSGKEYTDEPADAPIDGAVPDRARATG
jgi:hypothetical protein